MKYLFMLITMTLILINICIHNPARAQDCNVTIEKIANPEDNTPFDFNITGIGLIEFTLMDPSENTFNFNIPLFLGATITEEVPNGWILEDVNCIAEGGIFINLTPEVGDLVISCDDTGTASCQFTNSNLPSNIPTLSEWGLIAMAGILGIVGFVILRRRKVTA